MDILGQEGRDKSLWNAPTVQFLNIFVIFSVKSRKLIFSFFFKLWNLRDFVLFQIWASVPNQVHSIELGHCFPKRYTLMGCYFWENLQRFFKIFDVFRIKREGFVKPMNIIHCNVLASVSDRVHVYYLGQSNSNNYLILDGW